MEEKKANKVSEAKLKQQKKRNGGASEHAKRRKVIENGVEDGTETKQKRCAMSRWERRAQE